MKAGITLSVDLRFEVHSIPPVSITSVSDMLKFISKKVIRRGSGSKKSDKSASESTPAVNVLFEFSDANVARFTDLLEVAVRSKISNRSSDPLRIIEDESTDRLVSDFTKGSVSKYQLESYSPSSLWSAAVQLLRDSKPVFEEDKCNTLRSANYDDVSQLARSLPQHSQKLIGVLCASAEMLIRAEPAAAPMVLNSLSNSIIWSLPMNSFVTTNALVNLIVDHRVLFPSCHTFARKISSSFLPITPEEWRLHAKNSATIYAHQDLNQDVHQEDSDTDEQAKKGPSNSGSSNINSNNSASLGGPKPAGAGGDRLSLIAQGRGAGASTEDVNNNNTNTKSKPWRSAYTEELPLNDVNASASIDVSARLGLKPSAEPTLTKTPQHHTTPNTTTNNNHTTSSSKPSTTTTNATSASGNNNNNRLLTLKDLQGVFSSSLVSAASLDFLRVNTVVADDYADTKTLSSTVKWILQAQDLSDTLLSASKTGVGANKGIISWAEFLLLADPFLCPPDRHYLRSHNKTKYNQAVDVPVEDEEEDRSGDSSSRESSGKGTAESRADAKGSTNRSSLSQSQQKDNRNSNINNNNNISNNKLRSRGSFKSSSSTEDEDSDNVSIEEIKPHNPQNRQSQAKNMQSASRDSHPITSSTGKFSSHQQHNKHNNNVEDVADLDDVEEMELNEDPRNVSTHTYPKNNSSANKGSTFKKSGNSSSESEEEEEEERDHRFSSASSKNRVSHFNNNNNNKNHMDSSINRRRQWEDPEVTDDNISITSGANPLQAPVRRVSGNVNTTFGASGLTRQSSQNKNASSVFDLDLLDDSVASIPLMNDQSAEVEDRKWSHSNNTSVVNKHSSSALNKSADSRDTRGMPMHNSFDDVSTEDEEEEERESPIDHNQDNSNNDRPLSSSFVSDSDEADSFKMPPRHTNSHFTANPTTNNNNSNKVNTGLNTSYQSANRSLLANSFDDEDDDDVDEGGMEEGKEGKEHKHHTHNNNITGAGPLVGKSNSHIQEDPDQSMEHDAEGGLDGAPPIKKKHGVKKFMKMFSLTSTSASSKSSVNNSQTSSVHGSPLRHRANSTESEHTVNSLNTSTLDNTTLNAAAPKSKSMFGRMKSSVSKPFKSGSSAKDSLIGGNIGSNRSDNGSETGSQISAADDAAAALHAHRTTATERGRVDSIDSTDSAQINAHSALDDTLTPTGKVKKNMFGRITSKMSKPFKSANSSNRSDAGSEVGSQVSGTEVIAEQYRDQQRETADNRQIAKTNAATAATAAATAAAEAEAEAAATQSATTERARMDSIDSTDSAFIHNEGTPTAKVKKNMLGRITSKMSKPFKPSSSKNSDAGSETGSQISALDHDAVVEERTRNIRTTERGRADSIDSTDSAQINSETHLEGVPSAKVKKNMLGRITSKISKPFKSANSSNRSDAGSEAGSQISTVDQSALTAEVNSHTATASATAPPKAPKPVSVPASAITTATTTATATAPPKSPKPVHIPSTTTTAPAAVPVAAVPAAAVPAAVPKYTSYAAALSHQPPTDPSERTRAGSFDSIDSTNDAHIEGLPVLSGAKDTDSALAKPKKSVLGRVASKMSKPFKSGNKSESGKSDNGSEVDSQISAQDQAEIVKPVSRDTTVSSKANVSQGTAPLTAAALNQRAALSDTTAGPHSQLIVPRLERVSSLDSTSTHDQSGQPKLKKGMFGRITSKLSKPFKSNKSGTSSTGSANGDNESETGSQYSAEEPMEPVPSSATLPTSTRPQLTALKQPVSVMESVDLDSPTSGKAGSSGKYSIGIADSARDSHDTDSYSSNNRQDSVPIFSSAAPSPMDPSATATAAVNTVPSRLPPTPRTVSRLHRSASDAASEEGSVNSTHTNETTSSTGSKKGKPTLKGMMHKSYKVVFQGNKKSTSDNAIEDASVNNSSSDAALVAPHSVEPPEKPAKLPFRFKKAGERQAVEESDPQNATSNDTSAGTGVGAKKQVSPPKPVKPASLSHPTPNVSHLNPVPQPTSPPIYSTQNIDAGTIGAAPVNRPLPSLPNTGNINNRDGADVAASQSDVITADRRLSNPALSKKRSSFSLGALFGFGNSGSKENSRNSSRAPSRSNSFNGDVGENDGSTRESFGHRPHSTRDASPHRTFNGTGLAALLRGQVPPDSPALGRFVDRSVSTPMSPLTPTTPFAAQSFETNYPPDEQDNYQQSEDQAALEMSNVLLESSRLASQSILDRVHAQQSKYTVAHHHKVDVLEDLKRIKQKRASHDRSRTPSHHHRHLDHSVGSDFDDSDQEGEEDGNTSVSSPAQRKLLLDWKGIVARRAPQSVFLSPDSLLEMRQLVHKSRGDDVQVDLIALDDADEDAMHRQKRRQMSTVPDPLFGLSLHDKAALSHLRLSKALKHTSNRPLTASLSLKPVNAAELSSAQLNKLVQENAFYSELDLAMGVKFSGHLSRVVSRFWRHRYFVLMVEPLINPNLFPQDGVKDAPAPLPALPSPFVRTSSLHIDTSSITDCNPSPAPVPVPVLVPPTDPTAAASGPIPGKYQYFLLEYERCVSSQWGDVPVRLLKRYPAGDILSLRTDTRAHKKGLEFTVILRRNPGTILTSSAVGGSTKANGSGDSAGVTGHVSLGDFPSPLSKQHSSMVGQSIKSTSVSVKDSQAKDTAGEAKGLESIVKKSQSGGRFAAVVRAEQKAQAASTAADNTTGDPAARAARASAAPLVPPAPQQSVASVPAPAVPPVPVTEAEEPPVIETRWTRLLRRNSSKKDATTASAADTATSTHPVVPSAPAVAAPPEPAIVAGSSKTDAGDEEEEKEQEREGEPSEDEKEADSDPDEEGENDDNESRGDAATSVGGMSDFGDFYYRDGTLLPPGVNEADLRNGKVVNKKDFIKLKLKAPTPDERLQWVQIIHSIAAPSMYINTTSY